MGVVLDPGADELLSQLGLPPADLIPVDARNALRDTRPIQPCNLEDLLRLLTTTWRAAHITCAQH